MELLAYIGFGLIVIGGIWFLIAAFRERVLWGIGCLPIAPVSLFFLFAYWDEAKNPFLLQLSGIGLAVLAVYMGAEIEIL